MSLHYSDRLIYRVEVPNSILEHYAVANERDIFSVIARYTGRCVSAGFVQMVLRANGAATMQRWPAFEHNATVFTFWKSPNGSRR